jgi:hypothetical protein
MTINEYNNKPYIEITEDKVIFHRKLYKKEYLLSYIEGGFLRDDYTLKFLYKGKIVYYGIHNIHEDDKYLLDEFLMKSNGNKNSIFYSRYNFMCQSKWTYGFWIIYCVVMAISRYKERDLIGLGYWIIMLTLWNFIIYSGELELFLYNVDKGKGKCITICNEDFGI